MIDVSNIFDFNFGSLILSNLTLEDVYFTPYSKKKEITTEAVEGDKNTDITTHTKEELVAYEVKGFFKGLTSSSVSSKFEALNLIYDTTEIFSFVGTRLFDSKSFVIEELRVVDEGINYIEFEFLAKEVILSESKQFTTDSRNLPQTKKPVKKSKVARPKKKNVATVSSSSKEYWEMD